MAFIARLELCAICSRLLFCLRRKFRLNKMINQQNIGWTGAIAEAAFDAPVQPQRLGSRGVLIRYGFQQSLGGQGDRTAVITSSAVYAAVGLRIHRGLMRNRRDPLLNWCKRNTVDGTCRNTEFTAGAGGLDDSMHLSGSTNNCIYWAGGQAECAAYAGSFIDYGDLLGRIERRRQNLIGREQISEFPEQRLATGGAEIGRGLTACQRFGVGVATRIPALCALSLRQEGIDGGNDIIVTIGIPVAYPETRQRQTSEQDDQYKRGGHPANP